ncbi:MAG: molybdenum cofactor guanylyltransferase [Hyphomonadaceae bacterium]|nr:molybdenum cofactor guanylyltransferase [Hyphomonadaceae bacterium]
MTIERPNQARADLAAIFAGGEGRRMGGVDKGALVLGGEPLWKRVSDRLGSQANAVAVLARTAPHWLGELGARLIQDAPEIGGPPAGLLGALRVLEDQNGPDALLLTAPVDSPFLPADLFAQLDAARRRENAPAAIVRYAGRFQPVFGLWRAGCASAVAAAAKHERTLYAIAARAGAIQCEAWAGVAPDPFTNLNTPEDFAAAQQVSGDS